MVLSLPGIASRRQVSSIARRLSRVTSRASSRGRGTRRGVSPKCSSEFRKARSTSSCSSSSTRAGVRRRTWGTRKGDQTPRSVGCESDGFPRFLLSHQGTQGSNEGLGSAVSPNSVMSRRHMFIDHSHPGWESTATELHDAYEVDDKVIGKGGFGTVRRACLRDAPSVVRAVKTIRKRHSEAIAAVRQEIAILRRLDHPCICRLHEAFEDDYAFYMVLEYIDGKELFDEIIKDERLDEAKAAQIMEQVICAIQYCHEHGVLHRDLKPENIMVLDPCAATMSRSFTMSGALAAEGELEIKLIDFGLAMLTRFSRNRAPLMAGTEAYLSPESHCGKFAPASDIWSCGVVLHLLLTGCLPSLEVRAAEEPLNLRNSLYDDVSPMAKELLGSMLKADPDDRMDAAAVIAHPWISGPWRRLPRPRDLMPALASLVAFHRSVRMRRAALTVMATQLTHKQLAIMRRQFRQLDANSDGRLSKDELMENIAKAVGHARGNDEAQEARAWVEACFESIDTDCSNEIEYTEWVAAALQQETFRSEEAIRAAFRVFDVDGNGEVDAKELAHVLGLSQETAAEYLPDVDLNGDGVIDYEEFRSLFWTTKAELPSDGIQPLQPPPSKPTGPAMGNVATGARVVSL